MPIKLPSLDKVECPRCGKSLRLVQLYSVEIKVNGYEFEFEVCNACLETFMGVVHYYCSTENEEGCNA